ncbi:MAG: Na+/H+ antiporter subunit E [Kofleriaceae bacterium]|nr:Na+/H+ antiporter subunit E [Kofleriaceae bacterium]
MTILPAPLVSAGLLVLWLLLARSTSAGQIVLGLALAVIVPILSSRFWPAPYRVSRPLVAVRFFLVVGLDALRSNLEVAWGVVTWRWRRPASNFVIVPLDLRNPLGLAALSMVATVVPGTVWAELVLDRSAVLVHIWDVPEEAAFIARFKARYERPLMEIFE